MRRHYRTVALVISLFAAALVQAQTQPSNPLGGRAAPPPLNGVITGPLNPPSANALARPAPHVRSVTPVPEPSEWLMLLAGLGVVGVIARRTASRRRSDDE